MMFIKPAYACPYCLVLEGFYHADSCWKSSPLSNPRQILVTQENDQPSPGPYSENYPNTRTSFWESTPVERRLVKTYDADGKATIDHYWDVSGVQIMQPGDLGLPLMQWSFTWLEAAYGLHWRTLCASPDTPYSFWLGAEAA